MSSIQQNRNSFLQDIDFDAEVVSKLILEGHKTISNEIRDKDITLVIGCTGSGKSTLINYLLNNKLRFEYLNMEKVAIVDDLSGKYPKIGHNSQSCTIFPQVFTDQENKISYCDCPGFFDNRSFEERVSISINTQSAILSSKRIQAIIVVFTQSELQAQRGVLFKSLNKLLNTLIHDFESILPNMIFVLSRPNDNVTSDLFFDFLNNELTSHTKILEEKFKNLLNKAKRIIDSETKERESQFKFLSTIVQRRENFIAGNLSNPTCRNQIVSLIKSFRSKSIPKENFNFNSYDQDRMNLNNFMYNLSYYGLRHLRNCLNFHKTSYEYDKAEKDINSKLEFYNKEKERLENILTGNKIDESTFDKEKKNKQESIQKRIDTVKELKKAEEESIKSYIEESKTAKASLDELDTDEPCLHWTKEVNDKRLKFFGGRSSTKKTISYVGKPILYAKLYKSNGEFIDEHKSTYDNTGIYSVKYKSEVGKDGVAKVEIYIKKRDMPSNVKQIKLLKENLSELYEKIKNSKSKIEKHSSEINSLIQQKKELDQTKKLEINKNKYVVELNAIKAKIKEEKENLAEVIQRANKSEQVYNASKEFIKEYKNYFDMVEIINDTVLLESTLVDEFINSYNLYKNHDKSNKREDIEKEKKNLIDYYCPLSEYLMLDPYINQCGHSFEYAAVAKYIQENSEPKCPICKEKIDRETLVPNQKLNQIINAWYSKQMSLEYQAKDEIFDEEQFNNEVISKEKLEDEIKEIKLKLEEKEYQLKEIESRIEKWLKKKKKENKSEPSKLILDDQAKNGANNNPNEIKPMNNISNDAKKQPSAENKVKEKPELPPKLAPKVSLPVPHPPSAPAPPISELSKSNEIKKSELKPAPKLPPRPVAKGNIPPPPPPPTAPPISELSISNKIKSEHESNDDVKPKPSNINSNGLLDEINKFDKNKLKKVELNEINQKRTNNLMKDLHEAAAKMRQHVEESDPSDSSSDDYEEI